MRDRLVAGVLAVIGAVVLLASGAPAAGAQTGPGVTVVPDSGLRDGDVVRVTALDFFNLTFPLDATPSAYQCRAGALSPGTAPLDAAPVLADLLRRNCSLLGRFPVRGTAFDPAPPTSLDVAVHTTLVLGDGSSLRCGVSPDDCVVVVAGLTPPSEIGVAVATISFAPPTPRSKAECKRGGWRTLFDDQGRGFGNQGACVRFATRR